MTAQTASISYYSLKPQDTFLWKQTEQSEGLKKAALLVASIVAVPLELIARCFYNLGLWIYSSLCHRSVKPLDPTTIPETIKILAQPHTSVAEAIAEAQKTIPAEGPSDFTVFLRTDGTLEGQAIGDGLGLFTEFLTRAQAQQLKKANLTFADRPLFENRHVERFPKDGWTDDTDQALMIVNVEKENLLDPSKPKEQRMAEQLDNWHHHGLNGFSSVEKFAFETRQAPDPKDRNRNQIGCRGLGALTSKVISKNNFLKDPHAAAKEAWKDDNLPIRKRAAANGAVMRTGAIGAIYHNDLSQAVQEAIRYAKVTHADPRSIASAVAATVAIALLHEGASVENAMHHAEEIAVRVLWDEMKNVYGDLNPADQENWTNIAEEFEKELRECMHADLAHLNLEDPARMGYTFKTLGAGFHALRRSQELAASLAQDPNPKIEVIFDTVIGEIIWEGGDADTNAAVAGALVGAFGNIFAISDVLQKGLHKQDQAVLLQAINHCREAAERVLRK
jgi:ADP-ribosylglycohydrolase